MENERGSLFCLNRFWQLSQYSKIIQSNALLFVLTNSDTRTCIHKHAEFVLLRKLTSGHDMLIFSLPQYHIQVRHYSSQ